MTAPYTETYLGWTITITNRGEFKATQAGNELLAKSLPGIKKKITEFTKNSVALQGDAVEVYTITNQYGASGHYEENVIKKKIVGLRQHGRQIVPIEEGGNRAVGYWYHNYYSVNEEVCRLTAELQALSRQRETIDHQRMVLQQERDRYKLSQAALVNLVQAKVAAAGPTKEPGTKTTVPKLLSKPGFDEVKD